MSTDLAAIAAFIKARLDEDEAAARAAIDSRKSSKCARWISHPDGNGNVIGDRSGHFAFSLIAVSEGVARFVIDHDPARALREAEAGHRILSRHEYCAPYGGGPCDHAGTVDEPPCPDMRDLAARWSDHPDYRAAEWKP